MSMRLEDASKFIEKFKMTENFTVNTYDILNVFKETTGVSCFKCSCSICWNTQ